MRTKLKGLFIGVGWGLSGSEISLSTLLRHYNEVDQTLILPYPIFEEKKLNIKDFYPKAHFAGAKILPKDFSYIGGLDGWKSQVKSCIRRGVWSVVKGQFYNWLRKENFDFIHLNSYLLNPLITSEFPFILHIREIAKEIGENTKKNIEQARGIICIDSATRVSIGSLSLRNEVNLHNPCDMRSVARCDSEMIRQKLELGKDEIIFSIIGSLIPAKGVEGVVKAFLSSGVKGTLLVVGKGDSQYKEKCMSAANRAKNVRFLGETHEIEEIYAITDYVIRGDCQYALGRTVFEGLFSGASVILPGTKEEVFSHSDFTNYRSSLFPYSPNNWNELASLLGRIKLVKVKKRNCRSNHQNYVRAFHRFILDCITD